MKSIYTLFFLFSFLNIIPAQPGSFDLAFGTEGFVNTDINSTYNGANDIIVQDDGKIIVIGNSGLNFTAVRYKTNGDIDSTFGIDGIASIDVGDYGNADKVILQEDGKILIYGNANSELLLIRLNSNGNPDSTFAINGIKNISSGNDSDSPGGIIIQTDGKIIISGSTENYTSGNADISVMRLNSDGSIDSTFATNGMLTIDIDNNFETGEDIGQQSDGKIIVLGNSSDFTENKIVLIRLHSNGQIDSSFATNGIFAEVVESTVDFWNSSIILGNNKILVGGQIFDGSNNRYALLQFESNGSYDTGFGVNGKASSTIAGSDSYPSDIAVQSDGKIIQGGNIINSSFNYAFALARYTSDGTIDITFDLDGFKSFNFDLSSSPNDYANSVTVQGDDKILICGLVDNGIDGDIGIARLLNTNSSSELTLSLKAFIEGPYNSGILNSSLNLSEQLTHPYPTSIHDGTESVSSDFFTNNTDIVDWIIVELRTSIDAASMVSSRACFIKKDGSIVDLDGTSDVTFTGINSALNYYVVIHHRNHLSIMSNSALGI